MGHEVYTAHFNFYGYIVQISSNDDDLISLLRKDFSYFKLKAISLKQVVHLRLIAYRGTFHRLAIPKNLKSIFQNSKVICYEKSSLRYNDYHGKALGIFDFENEQGQVFSEDLSRLHELCYLIILSRAGKALDLKGLHRLHAMSVAVNNQYLVGMMPSGLGKSTYLMELINNYKVDFVSDDTPLIDSKGNVHNFPIRAGLSHENDLMKNHLPHVYQIKREHYGLKKLIDLVSAGFCTAGFHEKQKIKLFVGRRIHSDQCHIIKTSKIKLLPHLFSQLIIGIGTPVIVEYFWETGHRDFFRKSKIAIYRLWASIRLLMKAECYKVEFGYNIDVNAKALASMLNAKRSQKTNVVEVNFKRDRSDHFNQDI